MSRRRGSGGTRFSAPGDERKLASPNRASGCGGKRDADGRSSAAVAQGALSRFGAGSGGRGLVRNLERRTAGASEKSWRGNSPAVGRFRSDATRFRKIGRRENIRPAFRHPLPKGIGSAGETESAAARVGGRLRADYQWRGNFTRLHGPKRSGHAAATAARTGGGGNTKSGRGFFTRTRTWHAAGRRI